MDGICYTELTLSTVCGIYIFPIPFIAKKAQNATSFIEMKFHNLKAEPRVPLLSLFVLMIDDFPYFAWLRVMDKLTIT